MRIFVLALVIVGTSFMASAAVTGGRAVPEGQSGGDEGIVLASLYAEEEEEGDIGAMDVGFKKELQAQGVTFGVHCANAGSLNNATITIKGRGVGLKPIIREIDGSVTGAKVGDLDQDGWPELYVFSASAGSGSYGAALGFAVSDGGRVQAIGIPESPPNAKGYQGHDEYDVLGTTLVRSFPVYRENDTNAKATGGTRHVHYGLARGDLGQPVLEVQRVTTGPGS